VGIIVNFGFTEMADQSFGPPKTTTIGSSGFDLRANFGTQAGEASIQIIPSKSVLVGTGLTLEIPPGYEGQIRPRSGLALNHSVTVLNSPGTIDSDYRGEIAVILINHGENSFLVTHGDRIAQIVFQIVPSIELIHSNKFGQTKRGASGFGSSKIK
jgi:dUTP diphosphatase